MTTARHTGLDPFRKQMQALVFNKDRRDERQMVRIVGIDGTRAIGAQRTIESDEESAGLRLRCRAESSGQRAPNSRSMSA